MTFTIDPSILDAYRHRSESAIAAVRNTADALRSASYERDDLLRRGREHIRNRAVRADDPVEALHPDDRERLERLSTEIERLRRSNDANERDAGYTVAIAGRVTEFVKGAANA